MPTLLLFFPFQSVYHCYFLCHILRTCHFVNPLLGCVSVHLRDSTHTRAARLYQLFLVSAAQSYCMTSSQMTGTSTLFKGSERTSCWRHDLMFIFAVSLKGEKITHLFTILLDKHLFGKWGPWQRRQGSWGISQEVDSVLPLNVSLLLCKSGYSNKAGLAAALKGHWAGKPFHSVTVWRHWRKRWKKTDGRTGAPKMEKLLSQNNSMHLSHHLAQTHIDKHLHVITKTYTSIVAEEVFRSFTLVKVLIPHFYHK